MPFPALSANWKSLPDTGQTICYDNDGNHISCPREGQTLYGQDAQYYGLPPSYTVKTINNETVVIDNNTGLTWMQAPPDIDGDGLVGEDDQFNGDDDLPWQDAVSYCSNLFFAGSTEWRLPTLFELLSIVDYERADPAINTDIFNSGRFGFWSATQKAGYSGAAWQVHFATGDADYLEKTYKRAIRCVH